VARTTVEARQLLTQRPSYLKAYVIHSRGAVNNTGCTNNCAAAVRGEKLFTAFLGCVSIAGQWGGACSNCVWTDNGARCRFIHSHSRTGSSSTPANGASGSGGGASIPGPLGGRLVLGSDMEEQVVDAE
jgi:hypothetical protein